MLRTLGRVVPILLLIGFIATGVVLVRGGLLTTDLAAREWLASATGAQPKAVESQISIPTYFGSLEVTQSRSVTPGVGGEVMEVFVEVGDLVEAGQELFRLDATQLDWAVQRAEIALELARIALLEIDEQSTEGDLAVARANLEVAKTNLDKLAFGGVTEDELAATRASAAAAWARYNELLAGPTEARLQQLRASLERAELAVTQAQRAYNEVAWRGDVGRTPQAANLQRVTIDLNVAQASYNEATQPARASEVQGALAAAHRAQHALNELEEGISEVDLAVGRARVAAAEATVLRIEELTTSQKSAELRVSQALVNLEESQQRLDKATVRAPMTGVVLALNAEEGQVIGASSLAAEIGDPSALELVVGIPQDQVLTMSVGDPVRITRFGSDDISVLSTISKISPISLPGKGNSTFPVTIRLPEDGTAQFNPGIFVSATFE
ncbi:MAG: HlyD family efflux transporter periplasmic adaptor subunit [Caldilineaceae bacterium SB0668_bin_21]|nr:HlyD family efflux transporter periplasmic adaptor subunit [Caldilineaceae bacterium SB0668_bin_21]MYC21811.1 HlyD family efflux transporter periplasmic adaptor subunit [Caldilineaceae bacterium SB0662_bin_25]